MAAAISSLWFFLRVPFTACTIALLSIIDKINSNDGTERKNEEKKLPLENRWISMVGNVRKWRQSRICILDSTFRMTLNDTLKICFFWIKQTPT